MKNLRSTLLGILMIVSAIATAGIALLDSDPATNPDWAVIFGLLGGGSVAIMTREQATHDDENGE